MLLAMLSAHTFGDPGRRSTAGRWLLDALLPPEMDALPVRVRGPEEAGS